MANVCFHLQSRQGIAKKSGNWFGCSTLLFRDQYGNWTTDVVYWLDKESWDSSEVELCEEGTPVKIFRSDNGRNLAVLTIREDIEPLALPSA